jgi:hypothetical protein
MTSGETMARLVLVMLFMLGVLVIVPQAMAQTFIGVDHMCTDLSKIPESWIIQAKSTLHIAYGHTSHGSQLIDGMSGLVSWKGSLYSFNQGGAGGALDLHDYAMAGDVGYYPDWVNNTRTFLNDPANSDVNVIIWSWCGQAASQSEQSMITNYLAPMTQLELDYPNVKFVYMTGHLDGSGSTGNLHVRNEQIRTYCRSNKKILYDFADIESYDPDGLVNYRELYANDNCDYDSSGVSRNWAQRWQNTHTLNVDWYNCSAAHSQPLNGNRKAYAAWWLWARLAGMGDSSLNLSQGWNLVSIPKIQSNYSADAVFPGKYGDVFKYNSLLGSYEEASILEMAHGYWVYYSKASSIAFAGSAPSNISLDAQEGWNLLGSRNSVLTVSSLILNNGSEVYGDVFRYDPVSGSYQTTTVIHPGEAAWVYITKTCQITIP